MDEQKKYGRFLIVTLAGIFCVLALVAVVNIGLDHNHIFSSSKYYDAVGGELTNGKYLVCENCDIRSLKASLIKNSPLPQAIAIGSSPLSEISREIVGVESFFNLWASGANIEDIWAVLGAYLYHKGGLPPHMIIGVEPDYFEHKSQYDGYKVWQTYANILLREMNGTMALNPIKKIFEKIPSYKMAQAINPGLFWDNLAHRFGKNPKKDLVILDEEQQQEQENVYRPDGSVLLAKTVEGLDPVPSLFNFGVGKKSLDEDRVEQFKKTILFLQKNGVNISFFLPPWHPQYYEKLSGKMKDDFFAVVEEKMRDFAESRDIPVIGSYNPANVGWNKKAFRDSHHSRKKYLNDLVKPQEPKAVVAK